MFLFSNHQNMTNDPFFSDNLLFILLKNTPIGTAGALVSQMNQGRCQTYEHGSQHPKRPVPVDLENLAGSEWRQAPDLDKCLSRPDACLFQFKRDF
jgi:hypothetical protein